MKFKIIKNNRFAYWKWNLGHVDQCTICLLSFESPCSNKDCNEYRNECPPSIGKCTHIFHLHCVQKWLITNTNCPLCRNPWGSVDL